MSNVIDFPVSENPEDMKLLKEVIESGKFQDCHDKFFANYNISDMPFQTILKGFYLYGYLQAMYDTL